MSVAARALLFAVSLYQSFFSALMPSACKFYPSCSHYGAEALRVHGARRGSWLALKRIARCHPFSRGGVDLVPDAMESLAHSGHVNSSGAHDFARGLENRQPEQGAEKIPSLVILSEAKNLSSIEVQANKPREILRFAQNDKFLNFSAACEACPTGTASEVAAEISTECVTEEVRS